MFDETRMSDIDVWRDPWGIPHIRARSEDDAFAALGYVHAQDRLWQMEALLRRGTGHYAQWVGKAALKADTLARQLDTEGASRRDYAALDAASKAMLEAYARGVNQFIAEGPVPLEYGLLETRAATWLPWHSIAVMRQIGFLMGSVWWKLWRATALPILGAEASSQLRFDDSGAELLCIPPGLVSGPYMAAMKDLQPGIRALLDQAPQDASGGGSNNWALDASKTATGRPILAGDPHRALEMPNMYTQTHLACDSFDVIGLTVPGVPGFPHFAHNGSVAWCVTHAFMDIHDVYVERFDRDGEATLFKDQWEPVQHRREQIAIRGEADAVIDVLTTRHGPIIAGDPKSGHALALRSVQFDATDHSFSCLLPMLKSKTVEALFDTTRAWGLIDHNLLAADTQGTIGHRVRAKVPLRPSSNGWLPVPGWTGEQEWSGMVPFERMPAQINPSQGILVTANSRVTSTSEDYLCTDAMPPYRARRIWQRLAALDLAKLDDMASIHRDVLSPPGAAFRDRLRQLPGDFTSDAKALALHHLILNWDARMSVGSTGASAYILVRQALTRLVVERSGLQAASLHPYARVPPATIPEHQLWWSVPALLRNDDLSLLGESNWNELLGLALVKASETAIEPWGKLHQPKLSHLLSPVFRDQASLLNRASDLVGGDNDTVFATGCANSAGPRAVYASLSRYVFDVGAWENCQWIVFHGASGDPRSDWYMNQNPLWARGEMVPMMYHWPNIKAQALTHQSLIVKF